MTTEDRPARRTTTHQKLLVALAAGHTQPEAARIVGVTTRTIRRYVADPLFRAELEEAKRELVAGVCASMVDAATSAVGTLKELLASRDEWVKLKSANAILDMSLRYREAEQDSRIAALEERARDLLAQR